MSLNFYLHRHQVSLMRLAAAAGPEARAAHRGLVAGYARRVGELRSALGAGIVLHAIADPVAPRTFDACEPNENPDRGLTA